MTSGPVRVVTYRGATYEEAGRKFSADAAEASRHDWRVAHQEWHGTELVVTYQAVPREGLHSAAIIGLGCVSAFVVVAFAVVLVLGVIAGDEPYGAPFAPAPAAAEYLALGDPYVVEALPGADRVPVVELMEYALLESPIADRATGRITDDEGTTVIAVVFVVDEVDDQALWDRFVDRVRDDAASPVIRTEIAGKPAIQTEYAGGWVVGWQDGPVVAMIEAEDRATAQPFALELIARQRARERDLPQL